jgi:hypothetical protein
LISLKLNAQATQFSQAVTSPKGMTVIGSDLYVSESGASKIVKLDLNSTPPLAGPFIPKTDVLTGLTRPFGLSTDGTNLFIVDAGDITASIPAKIIQYNINTGVQISIFEFTSTGPAPRGILYHNGLVYVSDVTSNKIYVFNPGTTVTSLEVFSDLSVAGAGPVGMAVNNNTMYVAGRDSNIIYRINDVDTFDGSATLSANDYIDFTSDLGIWAGPEFLYLDGNTLYISGRDIGNVGSVDVTSSTPLSTISLLTSATVPEQIIPYNNNLYIAESSKITYFDLSVLSVNDNNGAISNPLSFKVYPNPTKDDINISGFEGEKSFKIYNLLGRLVMNGVASKSKKINISSLDSGMYLLKFDTGNVLKIIKE